MVLCEMLSLVLTLMVNFTNGNVTYKEVVKNLNILDHDYYFKFTNYIIKNLIHDSLLLYNEISSKEDLTEDYFSRLGFSLQEFNGF